MSLGHVGLLDHSSHKSQRDARRILGMVGETGESAPPVVDFSEIVSRAFHRGSIIGPKLHFVKDIIALREKLPPKS